MNVLITGASSGFGKDFAYIAAKKGYDLILVARRKEKLVEIQADIQQRFKVSVTIIPLDLTAPDAVSTLYKKVKNINILINNAGFGLVGPFATIEYEHQANMVDLNVKALMELTHTYIPSLIRNKGKILNVASTAAFAPGPGMATYFATKAFVLSFSEALMEELKKTGITVSVLCPGATATEFQHVAGFSKGGDASYPIAELGFEGMLKGKEIIVPGKHKLSAFLPRLLSRKLVRKMVAAWTSKE